MISIPPVTSPVHWLVQAHKLLHIRDERLSGLDLHKHPTYSNVTFCVPHMG